ncbi:tetratricopeptide repeat protein [Phorcysia thermohydrogeniphila]|uniref:TPR repeat protein n=1 Tax=Phorcysia thermohydrogeniphila TaxID=936138 RepID=A0A4R1GEP1_9BACT|nr:tetratricopeptide repeat protein [Phorcysia thermohydrogeniphila]TCK05280.1 TPR repeat protein [Phorcysia thermohydrogeniphila]
MKRVVLFLLALLMFVSCADLRRAELLYLQGKVEEASKELKELADRGFPRANFLLGKIALEEGDTEKAISYFKRAYELGYVPAAKEIATLYMSLGDEEEALVWLEIAAEKGDVSAEYLLYKYRLQIALREGDERGVRRVLKKLNYFARAKKFPKAYVLIGDYYYQHGKVEEAIKYYRRAYLNGFTKAGLKIASIYLSLGKKKVAMELYKELYAKGVKQAAYRLGKLYEKEAKSVELGYCPVADAKTAEDYLRLRKEIEKKKEAVLKEAIEWYRRAGDYLPARYRLLRLKWISSGNPCGDYQVMLRFAQNGVRDAYKDLVKLYAAGSCPAPEGVSKVLSSLERRFALEGGRQERAPQGVSEATKWVREAKRLLTAAPSKAKVYLEKACRAGSEDAEIELASLLKKKNPALAEAVFLYHASKGNPKAMFLLAQLYLEKGLKEKAFSWLEKAASLGYRPAIDYMLDQGEVQKALEFVKRLKDTDPCFYHLVMSKVYGEGLGVKPDFKKALEHLKLADQKNCPQAKLRLAQIYYSSGKYKKALKYVQKYLKYNKNDGLALALLAKIYLKFGNTEKAVDYLVKAIENGYSPQLLELQFLFNDLKDKKIRKMKLSNALLIFLADKLVDSNFNASVCYAYRAALNRATGAAIFILRLGTRVDTQEQAEFLKKVAENPKVCAKYLRALQSRLRRGNLTLSSLIEYLSSVGSSKKG